MQQSAPQPPVAMYVVHYLQPDQNNGQVQPQQQMMPGQPMQPMWGPYPQPVPYNSMNRVPMQYVQYPTYIPVQNVHQQPASHETPRLVPMMNPQPPPGSLMAAPPPNTGLPEPDKSRGVIPGPVQPLKATNAAPGPPQNPQGQAPIERSVPSALHRSDSTLDKLASVAAMQKSSNDHYGSAPTRNPSPTGRKRGRPPLNRPKKEPTAQPLLPPPPQQQPQSNQIPHDSSFHQQHNASVQGGAQQGPDQGMAHNPPLNGSVIPKKEPGSNFVAPVTILNAPVEPNQEVKPEHQFPRGQPITTYIPGLPAPPRALTNPLQVAIPSETENKARVHLPEEQEIEDHLDEDHEEAVDDEEVMWMEKDPVKRRKRSSNVFDEVLTMNPLYTADGFACPECDKKFKFRKHCRRHMVNHSGAKPFKCPKCPRSYTRKDTCQRHAAACRVIPSRGGRVTSGIIVTTCVDPED